MAKKFLAYFLMFLAITVAYCRDAIFNGKILLQLNTDEFHSVYSSMVYYRQWVLRGVFPFWNPLVMCGHPWGIQSDSYLNLFHTFSVFLGATLAWNAVIFAAIFFNGILLYSFLTQKGLSRFAASIGGLTFMLSTAGALNSGFFFLPLTFIMADRWALKRTRLNALLFTLSIALYCINANPQNFMYGALFIFFYILSVKNSIQKIRVRDLLWTAMPFVFGVGLLMFYFIPLAELAGQSNRSSAWTYLFELLPTHLLNFIFPNIFDSPSHPELNFVFPRILHELVRKTFFELGGIIVVPYTGLLAFLGALIAAFDKKQKEFSRFFLFSAVMVILYLIFHPFIYLAILKHVPFLKGMTGVERMMDVLLFSMAVLAAKGVDACLCQKKEFLPALKKIGSWVALLFAAVLLGFLLLRTAFVVFKDAVAAKITLGLHASSEPTIFIGDLSAFRKQRIGDFYTFFNDVLSASNPHFYIPVALFSFVFIVLLLYAQDRLKKGLVRTFLVLFVIVDLGLVRGFAPASSDPSIVRTDQAIVDLLKTDPKPFRVMLLEDKTKSYQYFFLRPEQNMIRAIETPDGYEQLYLHRYVDFFELLTRRKGPVGYILHTMDDFDPALADLINCKYFLTTDQNTKLDTRPDFVKKFEGLGYKLFENRAALPRAFIVHAMRAAKTREEAFKFIRETPELLKREVLLEAEVSPPALNKNTVAGTETVKFLRHEPNDVELSTFLSQEGYVVLSEAYYPNWRAFLDGRQVRIELADYAFRAVRVPSGKHKIEFRYDPGSTKTGVAVSMLFLIGLLGWLLLAF